MCKEHHRDLFSPSIHKCISIDELHQRDTLLSFGVTKLSCMSVEESIARNHAREKPVPKTVYHVYSKRFVPPSIDEGIATIHIFGDRRASVSSTRR